MSDARRCACGTPSCAPHRTGPAQASAPVHALASAFLCTALCRPCAGALVGLGVKAALRCAITAPLNYECMRTPEHCKVPWYSD